jgi:hypothetical protein
MCLGTVIDARHARQMLSLGTAIAAANSVCVIPSAAMAARKAAGVTPDLALLTACLPI